MMNYSAAVVGLSTVKIALEVDPVDVAIFRWTTQSKLFLAHYVYYLIKLG